MDPSSLPIQARCLMLIPLVGILAFSAPVAQAGGNGSVPHSIHGARIDLHADLDQNSMLGAGGRLEFQIAPKGLLKGNTRDELALSLGADVLFKPIDSNYYEGGSYVVPVAALQWNFYLGSRWSVFPEAGMAIHINSDKTAYGDHAWLYPQLDAGVGARYHINKRAGLLARVSVPAGLQLGMIF